MRLGAALLASMAASAAGHMIMQHPVPFGKETLNNSPLVDAAPGSSQSDYPCKKRAGVYKVDEINKMAVGQQVELNFTGSASHGGGTCQISVTLDKEPDVKSVFKVIQTYEGGCPTAQDGNSGSQDFYFKVPSGFPNGRATLAWTWYNKIGNREIYMNCAPIEVTGGSDSKDVYDSLPNMYLINLPTTGADACKSADSADVKVPGPGQYVKKAATAKLESPTGPGCAAAAKAITKGVTSDSSGSSGSSGSDSSSSAPAQSGTGQTAPSPSAESPAASNPAGSGAASPSGMRTVTTIASSSAAAPSESATSSASAVESNSGFPTMSVSSDAGVSGPASTGGSDAIPPSSTGSVSSGSGSGSSTCSSDGEVVCNGTSQFGLCNNGKVVWQQVAAGTKCANGQITKRSDSRHAHVRRHIAKGY